MQSLCGIHTRANANILAAFAKKFSNIPPTFLCDFLLSEEEDALFLNDLEDDFAFF